MKSVTRTEFLWLVANKHIKQYHGKLLDIVVTNGKSKRKNRYVTDECYEKLKGLRDYSGLK